MSTSTNINRPNIVFIEALLSVASVYFAAAAAVVVAIAAVAVVAVVGHTTDLTTSNGDDLHDPSHNHDRQLKLEETASQLGCSFYDDHDDIYDGKEDADDPSMDSSSNNLNNLNGGESKSINDLDSLLTTKYLDEIFASNMANYIGQDAPDEQLLDDLFSSAATKQEIPQDQAPDNFIKFQNVASSSPKSIGGNLKGRGSSKGIASYIKRSICNYIKRKELKFNYLKGLYHDHVNHQSHLDLLSRTTKSKLLAKRNNKIRVQSSAGPDQIVYDDQIIINDNQRRPEGQQNIDENMLKFYIYGKSNLSPSPMMEIKKSMWHNDRELQEQQIDFNNKKVAVLAHGYWNNILAGNQQALKDALLNHSFDYVMMFDWSPYCLPSDFFSATGNVIELGDILGNYLTKLVQLKGLNVDNVHFFGYSLGAHLIGFASRKMIKSSLRPVMKLTAFDPALPMFRTKGLQISDARTVQVIHTNVGVFGHDKQLGHYDYYPNGGSHQPGCQTGLLAETILTRSTCDHGRAIMLFTQYLKDDTEDNHCQFVGYPCASYALYLSGQCNQCEPIDDSKQECTHMSEMNFNESSGQQSKRRMYFIGGEPDNLCLANYAVKIVFQQEVDIGQQLSKLFQLKLVFSSKTDPIQVAEASISIEFNDKIATTLFVIPKPVKMDRVEIVINEAKKKINSINISYLSHSKKRIRDEYSSDFILNGRDTSESTK